MSSEKLMTSVARMINRMSAKNRKTPLPLSMIPQRVTAIQAAESSQKEKLSDPCASTITRRCLTLKTLTKVA